MSDELWISPMKVLYDDEGRPFSTDTRSDNGGHCSPPTVPCGVIHCIIKRAALAGLREVQKIVQKRKTFGRHQVRRDQIVDLLLPGLASGCGRKTKKAEEQGANGVLSLAYPKIQDQTTVSGEAICLCNTTHFLNEARLSNSRLTAHVDNLSASSRNRRRKYALELSSSATRPTKALR